MKFLKNFAVSFLIFLAGLTFLSGAVAAVVFFAVYFFGSFGVVPAIIILGSASLAVGFATSEYAE
jgi:hypothetical protein